MNNAANSKATETMTVTDAVARRLPVGDPLLAVLRQRSRAYGTVAGAIENYAGFVRRGQTSDPAGRQAYGELVDAIDAPRAQAKATADRLSLLIRDAL